MNTRFPFTRRAISALTHSGNGKATEYSDATLVGLKLEVSRTGRKVWYFRYTFNKIKSAIRIGEFPAIDLEEARSTAYKHRAEVDRGFNPAAERRAKREEMTFSEYANQVYVPYAKDRKSSVKDDISKLDLWILPAFGTSKLSSITRQEISTYHGKIKQSHTPATANRHLALIKRMLGLAIEWDYLENNAAHGIKLFKEENCRETFLSAEEASRLFAAMHGDRNPVACAALKIMLLTGVRRQEALSALWSHVDFAAKTWLLPKTKGKKPRHVLLSDAALQCFREQRARATGSQFVFPGRDPDKPLCDPKKTLKRLLAAAGIDKPFRIHDTRHSFASLLVMSGTPLFTVQRLLGHASASTTERYAHLASDHLRTSVETIGQLIV
ncbi:tyrosine-type recombinase/integrase [Paraburkholderia bannensis]|uniref:tyrosine-type recombinase/integrase n=1 Tax=Paraburkholderia bannensis TaxID=765414 RepID=UPI002AB7B133|nr:tyrosine-type recombinase/integrase [Paraburkholderia bannensis]